MNKTHQKEIFIEQYNKELDASLEQIKNGEFISHENVVKRSSKIIQNLLLANEYRFVRKENEKLMKDYKYIDYNF